MLPQTMTALDVFRLIKPYPVKCYQPVSTAQYQVLIQSFMPLCSFKPLFKNWSKYFADVIVPVSTAWIDEVSTCEEKVLSKRT